MIIIVDKPGQLCNRLWAYAPFVAVGLHFGIKVIILHFNDYADYFPNIKNSALIKTKIINNNYINKKLVLIITLLIKITKNFRKINFKHINYDNSCKGFNVIKAWKTEKPNNILLQHKKEIIELFYPKDFKKNELLEIKEKGFVLIGVHIRRGDYRKFKGGSYYYNDTVYLTVINNVQTSFENNGKKVYFFLCSDENVSELASQIPNCIYNSENHLIDDLYGLSTCDYIFGPPSTFSMWASFYGNVPLQFLNHSEIKLPLNKFKKVGYQNFFEDGTCVFH